MDGWLLSLIQEVLTALALPQVGLPAVFVVSLISATLLPLGSEPAVFAYVQLTPHMFWAAIGVATAGNTLGGAISYGMGAGAQATWYAWRRAHGPAQPPGGRWHALTSRWIHRFGPATLLLSWLPIVGDPLCAVAGWFRLPFWPCVLYMAIGKCLRYVILTALLMRIWPWIWP